MSSAAWDRRCPWTTRSPWFSNSLWPRYGSSTDATASLACSTSGSPPAPPAHQKNPPPAAAPPDQQEHPRARADAADPDHLARHVHEPVGPEQVAAVRRETRRVRGK